MGLLLTSKRMEVGQVPVQTAVKGGIDVEMWWTVSLDDSL